MKNGVKPMAGKDKLTQRKIETAKLEDKGYRLSDGAGLFLLVSPNDGKLWQKRYKFHGVGRVYSIGAFPLVSLKEAREVNFNLAQTLRRGVDPMAGKHAAKRIEKLEGENGKSLPELADTWLPPVWA